MRIECYLPDAVYSINQQLSYGAFPPAGTIPGSEKRGVEVGVAPLTIIPRNPDEDCLISSTSGSVGLEVLIPKEEFFHSEIQRNPDKYKAITAARSCWDLQAKTKREGQGSPRWREKLVLMLRMI